MVCLRQSYNCTDGTMCHFFTYLVQKLNLKVDPLGDGWWRQWAYG